MAAIHMMSSRIEPDAVTRGQHASDASVLELVLMCVRLRVRRRAAWLAHLSGHPGVEVVDALNASLETCLDDRDAPTAEAAWYERAEVVQSLNEELEGIERALSDRPGARLQQLQNMFRLSEPEMDLLKTCSALAIDPTLGVAYAHLQQHAARSYATERLAARLFGHRHRSLWSPACPLAVWGLVSAGETAVGEPPPLAVDPLAIDWLQGELRIDSALVGLVQIVEPREPLDGWPVQAIAQMIQRALERGSSVRVLLAGPSSSGRRTFAAAVAQRLGMQTLCADSSEIADTDWPDTFMRAQRLAVMGGAALVWYGDNLQRTWPANVAPAPVQFVACDEDGVVPGCRHLIDHRIDIMAPTLDERRRLWEANLSESAAWPAKEFETLVARYRLNVGDIVSVARRAPCGAREATDFAREHTRHWLGELGRLLDCPFTWDDLVVPDKLRDALEDFAFEARDRTTFWESASARRLFPRGTGLVALFSGSPGTGKTMAAQVAAADLELDLFRIDLATVVSKYIGETAKHLGQIFARATRMNAVLLFDEADALFSKRTDVKDAHDRYANADTSYLLQLLEEYRGIVILATNRKQNIDPAFIRRVRYVFDFPRPDASDRRRIWRQVVGELTGRETLKRLETAIEALAANVEMSGAQIKTTVLASIFIARRSRDALSMTYLLRGIERELGKEGRSLGAREQEKLVRDA